MNFKDLGVIVPILDALKDQGYENPTPIQQQSIPILLDGKDLLGCAQTGTGKTCAFAVPIIQRLVESRTEVLSKPKIKALVLSPTRELALQIKESFDAYTKYLNLRTAVIFGGVKQTKQTNQLAAGVDILVATPGRLLDLMAQKFIHLRDVEFFVLDEADQMLDMGFINDLRKILRFVPEKRQSLFFSATMVPEIQALADKILGDHEKVTINPEKPTAERVTQAVYYVEKPWKSKLLVHLLKEKEAQTVLVFTRTKYAADRIEKTLNRKEITAQAIHGNKAQGARQRALSSFKEGKTRVLVATDIAARGIDVSGLELVINFDLPEPASTYVHRIGRTGRANASGESISFCSPEEGELLFEIEKLTRMMIPEVDEHPYTADKTADMPLPAKPSHSHNKNRGGDKRRNHKNSDKQGGNHPQSKSAKPGQGGKPKKKNWKKKKPSLGGNSGGEGK